MQRAGKIAFIISGQGHEGAQVATAWPLRQQRDWMAPFYRSIASAITFGMSAEDIITAHLAKGDDVSSGGRQMPGHYGGGALQHRVPELPGRDAGAPCRRDRDGSLGARRRRRHAHHLRRGDEQPGRDPRGDELRRRPPPAGHLRVREQRLRDQRPARDAGRRRPRRDPRAGLRVPGRHRRRRRRARVLRGGQGGPRARGPRRGADPHRGERPSA